MLWPLALLLVLQSLSLHGDGIDVGNIVVAAFHKNFVVGRRLDCMSLL